tara:strand:+ start:983 stop:1261 length:279 start_codon:yes stop_codon:yes gene_type:complete
MALAGVSCADTVSIDNSKDIITAISSDIHNHAQESDWDGCSPLCSCNCCHVSFLSSSNIQLKLQKNFPQLHALYLQNFKKVEIADFPIPPIS